MKKRFLSVLLVLVISCPFLLMSVSASGISGMAYWRYVPGINIPVRETSFNMPRSHVSNPIETVGMHAFPVVTYVGGQGISQIRGSDGSTVKLSGSVNIYLSHGISYYDVSSLVNVDIDARAGVVGNASFTNGTTLEQVRVYSSPVVLASPAGLQLPSGHIAPEIQTLKWSLVVPSETTYIFDGLQFPMYKMTISGSESLNFYLSNYLVSLNVVAAATSDELAALEGMADAIVQQNQMMQAFYGNIMSVLNSIYQNTNSMDATLKLANTYLSNISTTVSGIHSLLGTYLHFLEAISSTATDIYSELESFHADFISKLDMLNATVIAESGNIQDKMQEIYELLVAYLDDTFASAVDPGLNQGIGDVGDAMGNNDVITQEWTGSLSESWDALQLESFTFGSGYTSAFIWLSSWWTNFFNALGPHGIVVLFPLMLGCTMLALGYSRHVIRRSRDGGGEGD